ncbi:MAG: RNA polymerase factor sigma-54 [bacterium]
MPELHLDQDVPRGIAVQHLVLVRIQFLPPVNGPDVPAVAPQFPLLDQRLRVHDHRLIVSQKHQQAIELLQYPVQELGQWVNQQLQENPLLEIENHQDALDHDDLTDDDEETDILDDVNLDELLNRDGNYQVNYSGRSSNSDHPEDKFRAVASQHQTLQDALEWQLSLEDLPQNEEQIAKDIISYIDEDGLFQGDIEELATEKDISEDRAEQLLGIIQTFEPRGVGGRSLKEVLMIQLRDQENLPEKTSEIIQDHLEDLQNRYFNKIADNVGVDIETVQEVADRVRALEPRPGRVHEPANRQYISPDVTIREVNDDFSIVIHEQAPPLSISAHYQALLESDDEDTEEYVKDKIKGAIWIIQCIHQRHETLNKVTRSIAEHQQDFFEEGVRALKPLVLQDIADDIDVHESTVSRAVQNKHVQTSQGLYPLDFFFSSTLETEGDGDGISSTAVKAKIQDMVENEDQTDPLSDSSIKERLNEEGIKIQRRTISKYRKQMQIPPWKLRKRVSDDSEA